jgi:hypothetical protein
MGPSTRANGRARREALTLPVEVLKMRNIRQLIEIDEKLSM